jgi:hypothetical protein
VATYYFDSNKPPGGDGSLAAPWNTFASAIGLADDDYLRLARGSVFRETLSLPFNGIKIDSYGDALNAPIISGADVITSWTPVGSGIFSYSTGSNVGGNVAEDGEPMIFKAWNTNLVTTNLQLGEYTVDPTGFLIYIRPRLGTTVGSVYTVSVRLYAWNSSAVKSNCLMQDIQIQQISRHGIALLNRSNSRFSGLNFWLIGGFKDPSVYVGNGIELSTGSNDFEVEGCNFKYIFDSACTTQLYDGSPQTLSRHRWVNLTVDGAALSGVEISCQTANQNITNVIVENLTAVNLGNVGWLRNRTLSPYGAGFINNGGATSGGSNICIVNSNITSPRFGIINASATAGATNFISKANKLTGTFKYNDTSHQGFRANSGSIISIADIVQGFTYGVATVGSAVLNFTANNSIFAYNGRATFNDNPNSTFNTNNCLMLGQTVAVHSGNYAGGYTGKNNALWENTANGANYSSTGDVTINPQLTTNYEPDSLSPLINAGIHLKYQGDFNNTMFNNPPTIGAFEYIRPRTARS